jgi:hypothetical protein
MKRIIPFVLFFLISSLSVLYAQSRWSFEAHGGEVYNLPMPLIIKQQGYSDVKLTAIYHTEALTLPVYWDLRLSRWQKDKSWEFEVIHHKLYLNNTSTEVQKFNISHGFNMLLVNRGFDKKKFHYRAGTGIVLAHPESNIRGKEFGDSGDDFDLRYYISGPIVNFSLGKHYRLNNRFYINAEAKTTLAYAQIKVADGKAEVYNIAFHLILGIGFDFIRPKEN